jgi:hypothetical protein
LQSLCATPNLMSEAQSVTSQRNSRAQSYFAWRNFKSTCVKAVMHAAREDMRSDDWRYKSNNVNDGI